MREQTYAIPENEDLAHAGSRRTTERSGRLLVVISLVVALPNMVLAALMPVIGMLIALGTASVGATLMLKGRERGWAAALLAVSGLAILVSLAVMLFLLPAEVRPIGTSTPIPVG
ncbi:hypothetical protein ICW40_05445 [Actinotalea ferrariae]|uniref:hypothetical protein n=1 Tax=Actinotalea ferrariae TaxID=1386098 RepID=UPI001C8CAEB3|nr:hypothetical protein [Actinotalea ferrariae]MBX9244251.1 hypothetical protein [Actinotalea ferrariae]